MALLTYGFTLCPLDVFRFDNNYSWINSKKLYYLIEVVEPDAGKELRRLDSTNM